MSERLILWRITLPQVVRRMLPGLLSATLAVVFKLKGSRDRPR
jgi:ABC-type arginine transport system permease subunit